MPTASRGSSDRDATSAARAVLAAFALQCAYFSGAFPPFANPNELSRFETVYAAVELKTLSIDRVLPVLGDHEDKSLSGGRAYSNKAPGLALAAIPIYRVLRIFRSAPVSPADPIFVWLRLLTVSAASVLALWRFLRRAGRHAALVGFGLAFGTPFLFYARTFFAHAWVAGLLYLSWDLLDAARRRGERRRVGLLAAAAGFLAGWAAISEYTAAPLVLFLALEARPRRLLAFAAGALVPLLVLFGYDAVCFGSPFVLSSAREAHASYASLAGRGLFGFGLPSLRVAGNYLFHPSRGLLLFSPFLLWTPFGFAKWRRIDRRGSAPLLAGVFVFFVLLTGYPNWHGGWALGDRYLLPVLFLAGLALPYALESSRSRALFAAAATFSAAFFLWTSATFPHFPLEIPWPPSSGALWFLKRGWFAPNVLSRLGPASLALPAAAAAGAAVFVLRAARPVRPSAAVLGCAGLLAFALSAARPIPPPYIGQLWRAAVYGAYSGRDPGRVELARVVDRAATPIERRQAAGAWRVYGPREPGPPRAR